MSTVCQKTEDGVILFWCPGCETYHGVWTQQRNSRNAIWAWNGSLERPTFTPSILVRGTKPIADQERDAIMRGEKVTPVDLVCHSYVTDGRIQFLSDCSHPLAGQTVDLVDEDEIRGGRRCEELS